MYSLTYFSINRGFFNEIYKSRIDINISQNFTVSYKKYITYKYNF